MMFFELSIIPTAQQRARHTRSGTAYKSREQEANERTLEALLLCHKPEKPLCGPVKLAFTAYMPIPASTSKKRRADMQTGKIGHIIKPDVDNLAKQLLDAMTRLRFWDDDRQIVELTCRKRYGDAPRWEICVQQVPEMAL